ncbi:MAG: dihydropteroate synthase [Planctomycetota bacterium]
MELFGSSGRHLHVGTGHTRVMGVVNVTPDSFSDGGRFLDPEAAIAQGLRMVREGADVLDVGGESTRPGYVPVAPAQQLERILPVIAGLRQQVDVPISVDTTRAVVAAAALDAGADWVNDTTALQEDPEMAELCADRGCTVVLMHRFVPSRKQTSGPPSGRDMVALLVRNLAARLQEATSHGIREDRIVLDPGIGFGTRSQDNLELLARIGMLQHLQRPLLAGPSRKSFLGELTGKPPAERVAATAAAVTALALAGVEIVRVHDVAEMVDVVHVADAIRLAGAVDPS